MNQLNLFNGADKIINEEDFLEEVLLVGTNTSGGKRRVIELYKHPQPTLQKLASLKKEFGSSGRSFDFSSGGQGYASYDYKGLIIHIYKDGEFHFSWSKIDRALNKLIATGKYQEGV